MEMQNSFLEENAPPISQFEIIVLKEYLIDERGNEIFKNAVDYSYGDDWSACHGCF